MPRNIFQSLDVIALAGEKSRRDAWARSIRLDADKMAAVATAYARESGVPRPPPWCCGAGSHQTAFMRAT